MQVKAASLYSGKGRSLEVISISKTGRKVVVAVPEFRTGRADFYRNAEGLYKNEYMGLVFRMPEQEQAVQAEPEEQAEAVPQCAAEFSTKEYEMGRAYGLPEAKASCTTQQGQMFIVRRKLVKVRNKHHTLGDVPDGVCVADHLEGMAFVCRVVRMNAQDVHPTKQGTLSIRRAAA